MKVKRILLFISILALFCLVAPGCGGNTKEGNIIVTRAPGPLPHLIFACELETDSLKMLFSRPELIRDLQQLHAELSISLPDFSPERAGIIQQLNQAGIPVDAWLVLPADQGYYLNAGNNQSAKTRFASFEKWTVDYHLRWAGIGLDIEPSVNDFASIGKGSKWKLLGSILSRSISFRRKQASREALEAYNVFIKEIKADGYPVQTYQMLFLADERKAGATILDRIFGLVPAKSDMEVLMVYSSFNHIGSALVYSYGQQGGVIAVGSTSPGDNPAMNRKSVPLNWDEFSKDLITASHFTDTISVYSLEGCVRQGFLSRLKDFDWDQRVIIPATSIQRVAHFRKMVRMVIWVLSYWIYVVIVLMLLIVWMISRRRARRIKKYHIASTGSA
jgi:hypothetical protein